MLVSELVLLLEATIRQFDKIGVLTISLKDIIILLVAYVLLREQKRHHFRYARDTNINLFALTILLHGEDIAATKNSTLFLQILELAFYIGKDTTSSWRIETG